MNSKIPLLIITFMLAISFTFAAPDPTLLTDGTGQLPDFAGYQALNVDNAAAGFSYDDPVTGQKVWKLTNYNSGTGAHLAYGEGGPHVSGEHSGGTHTILYAANGWRLVDYVKGVGVQNDRALPTPRPNRDLQWAWSTNPATPHIAYFVNDNERLFRFNTLTMTEEAAGAIPIGGKDIDIGPGVTPGWLHVSKNDEWFVWQERIAGVPRVTVAYNYSADQIYQRTWTNLDEPHMDRAGRYVTVLTAWQSPAENNWHLWDPVTDTATPVTGIYGAHNGYVQGYFATSNPHWTNHNQQVYDRANNQISTVNIMGAPKHFQSSHVTAQWIQPVTDTTQWFLHMNFADGKAKPLDPNYWQVHSGNIYRADVNWTPLYLKRNIGVKGAFQRTGNTWDNTLTEVNSLGSVTEGTFYFDSAAERVYLWAFGGGSPQDRVEITVPMPVHRGVGVANIQGSENKLLLHHYSVLDSAGTSYWKNPFASFSPDGKVVVFNSNMGIRDGTTDVFLTEMPDNSIDTIPAVISTVLPNQQNFPSGTSQVNLQLSTNENARCKYSTTANTPYQSMIFTITGGLTQTHSTTLSGLSDGNTYNYYIRCEDAAGNRNTVDHVVTFGILNPVCGPDGVTQPCGVSTVGACTMGIETCQSGVWVNCNAVLPSTEICDTFDNDCDGQVDEGGICAGNLLFSSTLYSQGEVTTPSVGFGPVVGDIHTTFNPTAGAESLNAGEFIRVPQSNGAQNNIDLDQGTVNFIYRPAYDHTSGVDLRSIFSTATWPTPGSLHLTRHSQSNSYTLTLFFFHPTGGGLTEQSVSSSNYNWNTNDQINITLSWDFTGNADVKLYLDGIEPPRTTPISGVHTMPAESTSEYFYIGGRENTGSAYANGVIGDFSITNTVDVPNTCSNGATRNCGTNVGACAFGTETCSAGVWGSCTGGTNPVTEICGDSIDNNCDGIVDDGCGGGTGDIPDPTLLPVANGQLSSVTAGGYLTTGPGDSLSSGQSYIDPLTGVTVWKVTDATTPTGVEPKHHNYGEGGPFISNGWGPNGDTHTLLINTGAWDYWLVDHVKGVGLTNWRNFPSSIEPDTDLAGAFSLNPATPRIFYTYSGDQIHRVDTSTNPPTLANIGNFPSPDLGPAGAGAWLHQDKNDEWFVKLLPNTNTTYAWNSQTNAVLDINMTPYLLKATHSDEPHIERNGDYVILLGYNPNDWTKDEANVWNLRTNSHAGRFFRQPPTTNGAPQTSALAHISSMLGYWTAVNADMSAPYQEVLVDPVANSITHSGTAAMHHCYHQAGQWIQEPNTLPGNDGKKAWVLSSTYCGVTVPGMRLYDGVGFFRADGSDFRILAHTYSVNANQSFLSVPGLYWQLPRGTISPDGKVVMFDSNQGSRGDVYLAEVPTSSTCSQTNGGVEICDGVDNDCNGQIDDGLVCTDIIPPVISNGQPSTTQNTGTTQVTLSVDTDEAATCRFSVARNVPFNNMQLFSTTGATTHTHTLNNLNDGFTYNAYVKCMDGSGNVNLQDYRVTFSVSNGSTLQTGDLNFDDKVDLFDIAIIVNEVGKTNGYQSGSDMNSDGEINIFDMVRLANNWGNRYAPDTDSPVIVNYEPNNNLPNSVGNFNLVVRTDESATCRFSTTPGNAFGSMLPMGQSGGIMHVEPVAGIADTSYEYYVKCSDSAGNVNVNDTNVSFLVGTPTPNSPSAIAEFSFDDGTGNTAADSSSNGMTATLQGATWTTGQYGGAVSFDGVDDSLDITSNLLDDLGPMTVTAWINPVTASGYLFSKRDSCTGPWRFSYEGAGGFAWFKGFTGTMPFISSIGSVTNLNTWQHVALVWDGTTNTAQFYVDGVETSYATVTPGSGTPISDAGCTFRVGSREGTSAFFQGGVDNLRIYDQVLTQSQIQTDMSTPIASCTDGATRNCGTDVGACTFGTETCSGGVWGSCVGGTTPVAETCDTIDNDCDGSIDEGGVCIVPGGSINIPLVVHRADGGSGSTLVSNGIPLRQGDLAPVNLTDVRVFVNNVEKQIYTEALDGRWPDGSIKFLLVQFNEVVNTGTDIINARLETGSPRQTTDLTRTSPPMSPSAYAVPSDPDYLVATNFGGLIYNTLTLSDTAAQLPPIYAQADSMFETVSDGHWGAVTPHKLRYDGGGYDYPYVMFTQWLRSGYPKYLDRAYLTAEQYYGMAHGNISFSTFINAHQAQPDGVLANYWMTGNDAARQLVVDFAAGILEPISDSNQYPMYRMDTTDPHGTNPGQGWIHEGRPQAKAMQGVLNAWLIGDTTTPFAQNNVDSWDAIADGLATRWLANQDTDGRFGYQTDGTITDGQKQFMEGLRVEAAIKYMELRGNVDLYPMIEKQVNFIDSAVDNIDGKPIWNSTTNTYRYIYQHVGSDPGMLTPDVTQALNSLINIGHAYLWNVTGNTTYRDHVDVTTIAAINDPHWQTVAPDWSLKQLNQNFLMHANRIGYRSS